MDNLVGYAKRDIPTPALHADLGVWDVAAVEWCAERHRVEHSEIAVLNVRLAVEADVLQPLPTARPRIGRAEISYESTGADPIARHRP